MYGCVRVRTLCVYVYIRTCMYMYVHVCLCDGSIDHLLLLQIMMSLGGKCEAIIRNNLPVKVKSSFRCDKNSLHTRVVLNPSLPPSLPPSPPSLPPSSLSLSPLPQPLSSLFSFFSWRKRRGSVRENEAARLKAEEEERQAAMAKMRELVK